MRPIRWDLIEQRYDQILKYATVLRLGTAQAEQVLRRLTRGGFKLPTYRLSKNSTAQFVRRSPAITWPGPRDPRRDSGRGELGQREHHAP
ncbi:Tn3 family transposase [Streptomyces sp. NPDC085944]|uniref:Tn3 family transposase n=1 Tax=Streptomyces sp. NPDC085944 TaxID=3154962 RepID=UPI00343F99EB